MIVRKRSGRFANFGGCRLSCGRGRGEPVCVCVCACYQIGGERGREGGSSEFLDAARVQCPCYHFSTTCLKYLRSVCECPCYLYIYDAIIVSVLTARIPFLLSCYWTQVQSCVTPFLPNLFAHRWRGNLLPQPPNISSVQEL